MSSASEHNSTGTYRGVIQDGSVVFEDDPQLPDGTLVQVSVRAATTGTPSAVLEAMSKPPHLATEDVAELLQEIEHGKRPVQFDSPLS